LFLNESLKPLLLLLDFERKLHGNYMGVTPAARALGTHDRTLNAFRAAYVKDDRNIVIYPDFLTDRQKRTAAADVHRSPFNRLVVITHVEPFDGNG